MKLIYPDYYKKFRCLAGNCPDTCCGDWEIVIDPATLSYYNSVPGALGARIRAALLEENGETRFALIDGHCPLLSAAGLCSIQLELGEEHLCKTCASHPRFLEEYGGTREQSLSISCPAAARLLLERQSPLTFVHELTEEPVDAPNELDAALYLALVRLRKTALALAQDHARGIRDRLALLLLFAVRQQRLLDSERYEASEALCHRFDDSWYRDRQLVRLRRTRLRPGSFYPCWVVLERMEHLTEEFPRLLHQTIFTAADPAVFERMFPLQAENLLVYFLFRYVLKAVNDGQLLSRVESCAFHWLAIRYLFTAARLDTLEQLLGLASLYSKEVEHSEENLSALADAFARRKLDGRMLLAQL